jgi:ribosomal-protein-alanine N-acetyltransferase
MLIKTRKMLIEDLDRVMEIEQQSFSVPWSRESMEYELLSNNHSTYICAFPEEAVSNLFGYAGMWIVEDFAQIMSIAVDNFNRRQGVGDILLTTLIQIAEIDGVKEISLEVRESNEAAKALYAKHGFRQVGIRKNYYNYPTEDAVILLKKVKLE